MGGGGGGGEICAVGGLDSCPGYGGRLIKSGY